jgi:hypothetical protein
VKYPTFTDSVVVGLSLSFLLVGGVWIYVQLHS